MKKVLLSVCLGMVSFVSTSLCHVYASTSGQSTSSSNDDSVKQHLEVKVGDVVWLENASGPLVISRVCEETRKVDLKPKKNNKHSRESYTSIPFEKLYFKKLVNTVYHTNGSEKKIITFIGHSTIYHKKPIRYGLVKGISYDQRSVLFITARYGDSPIAYNPKKSKVYENYFSHKEQLHGVRKLNKVRHLSSVRYKKLSKFQRFFN